MQLSDEGMLFANLIHSVSVLRLDFGGDQFCKRLAYHLPRIAAWGRDIGVGRPCPPTVPRRSPAILKIHLLKEGDPSHWGIEILNRHVDRTVPVDVEKQYLWAGQGDATDEYRSSVSGCSHPKHLIDRVGSEGVSASHCIDWSSAEARAEGRSRR